MGMSAEQKAAWLSARAGKLTASRMADAMAFNKDGKPAAKRTDLMHELLAERVAPEENMPHFVSDAMQWGLDHEDEAVDLFVARYGRNVHLSRFYDHPTIENFGATPDRELDDGLLEIKCPTTPKFVRWYTAGIVPHEHRPQLLAQLACTGKRWVGFIAYDPRVRDDSRRLFMRKFEPTQDEISIVEDAARAFLDELDAKFDLFVRGAA